MTELKREDQGKLGKVVWMQRDDAFTRRELSYGLPSVLQTMIGGVHTGWDGDNMIIHPAISAKITIQICNGVIAACDEVIQFNDKVDELDDEIDGPRPQGSKLCVFKQSALIPPSRVLVRWPQPYTLTPEKVRQLQEFEKLSRWAPKDIALHRRADPFWTTGVEHLSSSS